MPDEIFLTGVTGFIGGQLLQKLLHSSDARFHLLARSKRDESARSRIHRVLADLCPESDIAQLARRIEVLEGDVSVDQFGWSNSNYRRLAETVSHIIHCAAAARFDLDLDEARRTNVRGTMNILELASRCPRLQKIDYIGTAYVAGRRRGLITEDELDQGQEHHNTYERSKLEAEQYVRSHLSDLPLTIYRPSIVICDSQTGRVSRHSAFFRVLKMYLLGRLKLLPGDPLCPLDLVPVDYTADAISLISSNRGSIGRCYHLTAGLDNLTTLGDIRDLASRYLGKEKFAIVSPEQFQAYVSKAERSLTEEDRDMIEEVKIYQPYLMADLRFDNKNTLAILKKSRGPVPRVSSYFGQMAQYMIAHVRDQLPGSSS